MTTDVACLGAVYTCKSQSVVINSSWEDLSLLLNSETSDMQKCLLSLALRVEHCVMSQLVTGPSLDFVLRWA